MMSIVYFVGVVAYLWIGFMVLALDSFGGELTRKYPPILIILLWFPWLIASYAKIIWEDWFTVRK